MHKYGGRSRPETSACRNSLWLSSFFKQFHEHTSSISLNIQATQKRWPHDPMRVTLAQPARSPPKGSYFSPNGTSRPPCTRKVLVGELSLLMDPSLPHARDGRPLAAPVSQFGLFSSGVAPIRS